MPFYDLLFRDLFSKGHFWGIFGAFLGHFWGIFGAVLGGQTYMHYDEKTENSSSFSEETKRSYFFLLKSWTECSWKRKSRKSKVHDLCNCANVPPLLLELSRSFSEIEGANSIRTTFSFVLALSFFLSIPYFYIVSFEYRCRIYTLVYSTLRVTEKNKQKKLTRCQLNSLVGAPWNY